ncbi:acylphosphatase [Sulfuritortus calidifontis]|uniref:Acylphosphatase n=1 Tax=Sulfuritortus calidifontis TaxID=1914471 RepID=A0A4R3JV29_9PROT|nr:acylphosphatase [Sulfuritortus calidifontis]TCS70145.1 acylphosphatase [Sulfuritortus calidifontis]
MRQTRHLQIHGRVQGVWFRDSMCREAERLGVTGWVRNRGDGTVEAVVQGEAAAVQAIIDWAHRGPPKAEVLRVEIDEAGGEFSGFEQRPSA